MEWYLAHNETNLVKLLNMLKDDYLFDYANWLIAYILNQLDGVKYSLFAAELVIDVIKKNYPNDTKHQAIIDGIKEFIIEPTELNRIKVILTFETNDFKNYTNFARNAFCSLICAAWATQRKIRYHQVYNCYMWSIKASHSTFKKQTKIINYGITLIKEGI